jgi:predicted metal-dependent HD superfamily phosphohydrolase
VNETAVLDTPIAQKAQQYVRELFERAIPPQYVYHNYDHTLRVARSVAELAGDAQLSSQDTENLVLCALFHDCGFSVSATDHETHSKAIAERFLEAQGMPRDRIEEIGRCIDATRLGHEPASKLEMLIKDADTSGLGQFDFFESTERLRQERNAVTGEAIDELAWDRINRQFLSEHEFYTDEARRRYTEAKQKHLRKIEKRLTKREDPDRAKPKEPKRQTIATSKSAQTQFKTSLRNHIDLSVIADNKANIMLSVNALIITFTLPLLGQRVVDDARLLLPTLILLSVCVGAMIFATLATRPGKMPGLTRREDVFEGRSNLFFFGNFYRMRYQDYEEGMIQVVGDDKLLDTAIIRDLFFLGATLGRKYEYLRRCYNLFMYGMIAAVASFAIVFGLSAGT